jgi:hypothetical protein
MKKNVAVLEHSGVTMSRLARIREKSVTAKDILRGALDKMPDVAIDRLIRRGK